MAITYLQYTDSGKVSNVNTTFPFAHTVHANANLLVVCVSGFDDSVTDCECVSVSSNQNGALSEAIGIEHVLGSGDASSASIWYKENPTVSVEHTITVGFSAKTSNASATAIDLSGVDTADALESSDTSEEVGGTTSVTPATGDFTIGQVSYDQLDPLDISVSVGNEIVEVDLGSVIASSAWVAGLTITWADADSNTSIAVAAAFNEEAVTGVSKKTRRRRLHLQSIMRE